MLIVKEIELSSETCSIITCPMPSITEAYRQQIKFNAMKQDIVRWIEAGHSIPAIQVPNLLNHVITKEAIERNATRGRENTNLMQYLTK